MTVYGFRAICFDLDETLLDDERGAQVAAEHTTRKIVDTYPNVDAQCLMTNYLGAGKQIWSGLGKIPSTGDPLKSGDEIRVKVWSLALAASGVNSPEASHFAARTYAEARRTIGYIAFEDVEPTLHRLHGQCRMAVITNGTRQIQLEKLAITQLSRYFDVISVSEELGYGKPDPQIFDSTLRELDVPANRAVHVGDNLDDDIAGALAAGMSAVLINRGKGMNTDIESTRYTEISSLEELKGALQRLATFRGK